MAKSLKPLVWTCVLTAVFLLSGCGIVNGNPNSPTDSTDTAATFQNLPRLTGNATVELMVNGSPIIIEIAGNDAPITAGNFVDLVSKNFYNGLSFHRVVRDPSPFVAQAGDPLSANPSVPLNQLGRGGYKDSNGQERNIPLEILPEGSTTPVYSTTFPAAGIGAKPKLQHSRGAVAMARSQYPDSASSQFYITLGDANFLDGNYAVFGYVTEGMDVVDGIKQGDTIKSARVISGAENLKLPQ
ncbi:peptidylprolyl isomerase [Prochlorothrix hollandica]|uniref:Peptidyl-prolyl cis-trans isomerase n=1 Tax=Prochlorothrix hollandica PCC 9006 = CALU 1027 TaxID=317619 RepID=A0A0M2PP73_PROHO|nr:peptidylprolyl isomerase [Prochlorothrix hollandica]KKI98074.1 peptidylprolyl isomerase [Prochlorothrix hollandica PCC 9006 = CALU 1027]